MAGTPTKLQFFEVLKLHGIYCGCSLTHEALQDLKNTFDISWSCLSRFSAPLDLETSGKMWKLVTYNCQKGFKGSTHPQKNKLHSYTRLVVYPFLTWKWYSTFPVFHGTSLTVQRVVYFESSHFIGPHSSTVDGQFHLWWSNSHYLPLAS